jgi:hypothetical protein
VLVGDEPRNDARGRSQFRLVDPDRAGVAHPQRRVALFKIEPVTFEGFVPLAIGKDPNATRLGQNLTIAGYGTTGGRYSYPGEVYETSVQAGESYLHDPQHFQLGDTRAPVDGFRGPCQGACSSAFVACMAIDANPRRSRTLVAGFLSQRGEWCTNC